MSSHHAGLSPGTVMDRVSAKQEDAIKRRINRDARFKLLARLLAAPCNSTALR